MEHSAIELQPPFFLVSPDTSHILLKKKTKKTWSDVSRQSLHQDNQTYEQSYPMATRVGRCVCLYLIGISLKI